MVGGTQATETRVKNTAGERSGCKTKHCAGGGGGGLGVAIKKWSRTPNLSKLTHMIISCGDLRLVGSTRHRKVDQT